MTDIYEEFGYANLRRILMCPMPRLPRLHPCSENLRTLTGWCPRWKITPANGNIIDGGDSIWVSGSD